MQNKVNLNAYNNDWFKEQIGASRLKQAIWHFINVLFFINPMNVGVGNKVWLIKKFGAKVGNNVIIKPGVSIKYPWLLTIGNYSWIGENAWIDNLAQVTIGNNVCISQGAMLLTGNHDYKKTGFDLIVKSIEIQDGVWIGAKATVCPGVICGTHSILTVSSVAAKNMAPYKIYQGNPAEETRDRLISRG